MVEPAGQTSVKMRSQGGHAFVAMDGSRLAFDVAGERATGFMYGTGSRRLEALRKR